MEAKEMHKMVFNREVIIAEELFWYSMGIKVGERSTGTKSLYTFARYALSFPKYFPKVGI